MPVGTSSTKMPGYFGWGVIGTKRNVGYAAILAVPSSHKRSAVDRNGTHFSSTLNPLALGAQPGRSLIHAIKYTPHARINMLAEFNVEVL